MSVTTKQLKRLFSWPLFFLVFTITMCSLGGLASPGLIVGTFSEPGPVGNSGHHRLQHLVVDKQSGLVYVGGVNKLYQLSPDLNLQVTVQTGPREDSPECPAVGCSDSVVKRLTDNVNKALVIDYKNTSLITCGTLFQGSCSVRNLKNISEELMDVREPVVANNSTATTVVFIAPEPWYLSSNSDVLYVGATYTGNSPYRSDVPAVSSRSLARHKMFQIANMERREVNTWVTTGTRISVDPSSRDRYPIHYVYGFSSERFSYFLTTQMKESTTNNSSYISKLVRVCQSDSDFSSYTEVPLECGDGDGTLYNLVQAAYVGKPGSSLAAKLNITIQDDVLYAVFAQSESAEGGEMSNRPVAQSALCVYSLKSIRGTFLRNIRRCFRGEGVTGLDFISPSRPCTAAILHKRVVIEEDFCFLHLDTPLGGDEPVFDRAVFTSNEDLLTAVVATSIGNSTVVFLGTSKGHLKKMVVENVKEDGGGLGAYQTSEYGDITVDEGSRVASDLVFDPQQTHLYVMTERKVTKVRVQDCETYKCGECRRDPYCGWCWLENKCSLRSDCQHAAKDPLYWNSYKGGGCPTLTSVTPNQIQRTTARTLSLVIDNLPDLSDQFQCAFSAFGNAFLTNATRTATGVSCTTPRTDHIPANPIGQHHFTAKLSVLMTDGPNFVATNFTFFDCATYTSCTECVSLPFPCDWCVDGDQCTHETAKNCLVTGVNRIGPSLRSGPNFCPRINATANVSTEIFVSHGIKKSINVRVENIFQFIAQTNFVCQFGIEGQVTDVWAKLRDDVIYCDDMEFTYSSRTPNITATFAVIWDGSRSLDNPNNVHIIIYRCSEMVDHCIPCHALSEKYQCGWCQTSGTCEVREQCDEKRGSAWLDRDQICPNLEFYPRSGPLEGGTNVTIKGVDFGMAFSDTGNITVAGVPCRPYEELYVQSNQIVCLVDKPETNETRRGPVIVRVFRVQSESADYYEFVNPVIESIHPTRGPLSGGTQLTIRGQFLNAGSSIQAVIDSTLPCIITYTNTTHAVCRTSASKRTHRGYLHMSFDHGRVSHFRQYFEYVEDPIIYYAESGDVSKGKGVPRGIPSGGIIITVIGNNFQSMQEPKLFVRYENKEHTNSCHVLSNHTMECRSPSVPDLVQKKFPVSPLLLDYGFLMDDVLSVRNLSDSPKYHKFELYPDPVYDQFEDKIIHYKGDNLTIYGRNLNQGCQEKDVEVRIGTAKCNVTSISRNQLTCQPPAIQPPAAGPNPNDNPEVVVVVAGNLHYAIGKLSYELPLPISIVIAVGTIGLVILVVVVIVFIVYRLKWKKIRKRKQESNEGIVFFDNSVFPQADRLLRGNPREINCQLPIEEQTEFLPYDTRWEFPHYRLRLGAQLGAGCFGRVLKAEAIGIKGVKETVKTVAVKMAKSKANVADLEALVAELKILIYLGSHLNVLNLLGACTTRISKGELLIIIEYCPFGNLQTFLLNHRNNFVNLVDELGKVKTDYKNTEKVDNPIEPKENFISLLQEIDGYLVPDCSEMTESEGNQTKFELQSLLNDGLARDSHGTSRARDTGSFWIYEQDPNIVSKPPALSTRDLISWSFQVARGMDYLASKKVLHGDLAARNVLLAEDGVVKVADFGLARKMYYEGTYEKKTQGPMPIRWMAIESFTDRIFSSQSDVWSYGIFLWELFSLGKAPYPEMEGKQVIKELQNGYRMEVPQYAPRVFGEVMKNCWATDPKERPTFSQLEIITSDQMQCSVSSYYLDLNIPYENMNKEKENASPEDHFGLAKLLDDQDRLAETNPNGSLDADVQI